MILRFTRSLVVVAAAIAAFPASAFAQKPISLEVALEMAHAAMDACHAEPRSRISVAVVGYFMRTKVLLSDDGADPSTTETCKLKADSAILFNRATGSSLPPGATHATPTVTPGGTRAKGGVPIELDGVTIGAIGVSGATGINGGTGSERDEACARAGVAKVAEKMRYVIATRKRPGA